MVRSDLLTVTAAGAVALHHDFIELTRRDVTRAELVIVPVVPVLLLLVFGSVVAALVPFGVGLLAVAGGMAVTVWLTRVMSVSVYAPNVVTMIGLAVAIVLMAVAAGFIASLLASYPWITWIGLLIIVWVALDMIFTGSRQVACAAWKGSWCAPDLLSLIRGLVQ